MLSAVTIILSPDLGVADGDMIWPKYIFNNTVANITSTFQFQVTIKNTIQLLRLESSTLKRFSQNKKFKRTT